MKFGQQFNFHKIPEWSEYYFDYKALKKFIKEIIKKQIGIREDKKDHPKKDKNSKTKLQKSKSLFKSKKKDLLLEREKIENDKLERRISDVSNMNNISIQILQNDEYFYAFREKFIEFLNVVNTFFKSKYQENLEEFECLKKKIGEKNDT